MAHIVQGLTDSDVNTVLLSVNGIGAFDLASRDVMMRGLLEDEGGRSAPPFSSGDSIWITFHILVG